MPLYYTGIDSTHITNLLLSDHTKAKYLTNTDSGASIIAGSAQKPVKAKAKGKTSKESKVSSSSKTPKKKKANITTL